MMSANDCKNKNEKKLLKSFQRQAGTWIDESKTKIGYEINFTKYFYEFKKLRSLEEIKSDILALEKETTEIEKEVLI